MLYRLFDAELDKAKFSRKINEKRLNDKIMHNVRYKPFHLSASVRDIAVIARCS